MKKFTQFAVVSGAALALAACGSSDDASSEADAESVEMPAEEAMADVTEEPVMDEEAAMADAPAPAPVTEEEANSAADDAEDVIAAAEAAADAAGDAADAAEAMADAVE
ncbi:hypothetical protein ACRAQ6_04635 [Erythrobacter sp. HA6-11]